MTIHVHRGQLGYGISGADARGRRVRIFCRTLPTARAIQEAARAGDSDAVDQLLRQEATP